MLLTQTFEDLQEDARTKFGVPDLKLVSDPSIKTLTSTGLGYACKPKFSKGKIRNGHPYKLMDLISTDPYGATVKAYVTLIQDSGVSIGLLSLKPLIPSTNGSVNETNSTWKFAKGTWFDIHIEPLRFLKGRGRYSDRVIAEELSNYIYSLSKSQLATKLAGSTKLSDSVKIDILNWSSYILLENAAGKIRRLAESHHLLTVRWNLLETDSEAIINAAYSCGSTYSVYSEMRNMIAKF